MVLTSLGLLLPRLGLAPLASLSPTGLGSGCLLWAWACVPFPHASEPPIHNSKPGGKWLSMAKGRAGRAVLVQGHAGVASGPSWDGDAHKRGSHPGSKTRSSRIPAAAYGAHVQEGQLPLKKQIALPL